MAAEAPETWDPPLAPRRFAVPESKYQNPIDRFFGVYLQSRNLSFADPVSDHLFARRAYLDIWGMTQPQAEVTEFLHNSDPGKHARLIDHLLEDSAMYTGNWLSFWNDLLRNDQRVNYAGTRKSITPWLQSALNGNLPYDKMVAALLNPEKDKGPEGVADRFHLFCNLTAAAERVLQQKRFAGVVPSPPDASPVVESGKIVPLSQADLLKEQRRQRRLERYNEVTRLYREGYSQNAISEMLGIQRKTIRRFLRSSEFPERSRPKRKPGRVDQFRSFLVRRWAEGCHNATQLWHEIREQGYGGARGMVARLVSTFRSPGTMYFRVNTVERKSPKRCINPSASQVASLFSRRLETLSKYE